MEINFKKIFRSWIAQRICSQIIFFFYHLFNQCLPIFHEIDTIILYFVQLSTDWVYYRQFLLMRLYGCAIYIFLAYTIIYYSHWFVFGGSIYYHYFLLNFRNRFLVFYKITETNKINESIVVWIDLLFIRFLFNLVFNSLLFGLSWNDELISFSF